MTPAATNSIPDELVARSAAGDAAAQERLAEACLPFVWRTVFLACGGGPDVDDLAQSAMIQAFRDLPRFRGTGSFTTWLHRVTVNVVRQHYRRRAARSLLPFGEGLDRFADGRATAPDEGAEGGRLLERLAHHLSGLKPKNRMAVILSLVEGHSVSEIALISGCKVETAKKRLLRGRRDLVARIRRDPYCRQMLRELGL